MNWPDILISLLPEHLLLVGVLVLITQAVATDRPRGAAAMALFSVAAAALAALWLALGGYHGNPFPGQVVVTPAAHWGKAFAYALALPVLLLAQDDLGEGGPLYPLLLSSLYGLGIMLSSDSFLTLFLGLELMSLPVYVLVLFGLRREATPEAALKYIVLGGAATATLLMGIALLYGHTGSLGIASFTRAMGSGQSLAVGGTVLVLLAFFVKGALVPFHAWAPDAYEGASLPVTAYMATVVKAGVVLAALRLFGDHAASPSLTGLLLAVPLASMVWGNLAAMRQAGLRRLIAYSSIAHAGYLFMAFLGTVEGRQSALLFYLLAYGLMTVLSLAALPSSHTDADRDRLLPLQGLYHRQPVAAIVMGLAMLSLAGIPPLPGFVAKFAIFRELMAAGHPLAATAGLVASYLGLYAYLRVIQAMFMNPATADAVGRGPMRSAAVAATVLCGLPALALAVGPGWLLSRL